MNEILEKMKTDDPALYNALALLIDRLKIDTLNTEVIKSIVPKPKIKELHNFIFSGQEVKIVHSGEVLFRGHANELPYCYFKDCEVKTISTTPISNDGVISIVIDEITKPI